MSAIPQLVLYTRAGCSLCAEARDAIHTVIDDRRARVLPVPRVVEVDIETDQELQRTMFDRIPIVELGDRRVELIVTVGKLRRLLSDVVGDEPMQVLTEWS